MNIMLVAVSERRREIGLRRAVGATKKKIRNQFIIEAILLCFLGGILGTLLGILAAVSFSLFSETRFYLLFSSIPLGLSICTIVGLIFGYYPAKGAAEVESIEALQG